MVRSIRARLLIWYAVVLAVVVVGFAGILYGAVRQARLRESDAHLEAAVTYLDSALRVLPPHELEGAGVVPPPFPHPPGPPRERAMADLMPPQGSFAEADPDAAYFVIWRADGTVLKGAGPRPELSPPENASPQPSFQTRGAAREVVMLGPGRTRILVGRSMAKLARDQAAFAWQLAAAGGVVLLVGLAGGWLISARIFRPLTAITATAARLTATNLTERIPLEGIDRELLDLGKVLNETFDRLQTTVEQLTRFTADASHELRTPLAVIRSNAQLALARPRSADDYRQAIETCLQAAKRMSAIVDGLLTLARSDAGKLGLNRESIALDHLVVENTALVRALAEDRGIRIELEVTPVGVVGDREALTRIISNLLSNAVRYNRPGGEVRVRLTTTTGEAILTVADTGPGIPAADQEHIFDRFYRVDKARDRSSGGTGLGLAICRSLAEAHGGSIDCQSKENEGTTFWVRLPRAGG